MKSQNESKTTREKRQKAAPPHVFPRGPTRQTSLESQLPPGSPERSRLKERLKPRVTHGGEASKGRRKTPRPFTGKAPVHLVLKSSRAKGSWSLLHRKHKARIQAMIYTYGARYKVRVYRASNVGNHLHLLVKAKEKKHLSDFLRILAGRVAVTITGAYKGVKKIGKFWDHLCFSRLVNWGQDFYQVREYLERNLMEQAHRRAEIDETPSEVLTMPGLWEPSG